MIMINQEHSLQFQHDDIAFANRPISHIPTQHHINNYGSLKPLLKDSQGNPRFMLGPHYLIFLTAFSLCSLLIALFIVNQLQQYSTFWKVILVCSSAAFLLSYLHIGFSKPGVAFLKRPLSKAQQQSNRYCHVCQILRERKTEHCDDCGVCILQYDHHCPWVGKCVGKQNLCGFYVFIVCTFGNLIIIFIATSVSNLMQKSSAIAH